MCISCNNTAATEIYTLSLHDALPIYGADRPAGVQAGDEAQLGHVHVADSGEVRLVQERLADGTLGIGSQPPHGFVLVPIDRKSTRRNSSHANNSYSVFCL